MLTDAKIKEFNFFSAVASPGTSLLCDPTEQFVGFKPFSDRLSGSDWSFFPVFLLPKLIILPVLSRILEDTHCPWAAFPIHAVVSTQLRFES